jgi:hypothetical protein
MAALALIAFAPALARGETRTATGGQTTATLTFTQTEQDGLPHYTGLRLAITRAGQAAYDAPLAIKGCEEPFCAPVAALVGGPGAGSPGGLTVADLDGDGEPEVVADLFTGGAHCCAVSRILRWTGSTYAAGDRVWGDPAYQLRDVDRDGIPEFVTADDRFAYTFASYAESFLPVRVLSYRAGRWRDVTRTVPKLVRAEAKRLKQTYMKLRRGRSSLGVLAAWAADEYRLGHKKTVGRFLRSELRAGRLRGWSGTPQRRAFIRVLERRLKAWRY